MHPLSRFALAKIEILLGGLVVGGAIFLLVPAYGNRNIALNRTQCLANLERIGAALGAYLHDHDDHWPYVGKLADDPIHRPPWPTLAVVLNPYLSSNAECLRCPADRRELAPGDPLRNKFPAETTFYETEGLSYEWQFSDIYGGKKVGEETLALAKGFGFGRADQPLLRDFEPFHAGDGAGSFNTLNADLKARTARDTGAMP